MFEVTLEEAFFPAWPSEPAEEVTIGGLLAAVAAKVPGKTALKELLLDGKVGRSWTYEALYQESLRLAHVLAARHARGSHIAIWAPNSPEWVIVEFAAALAGLVLVTVNPSYQARELKYVLHQSGAEALYLVEEYRGNPMGCIAAEVCAELDQVKHQIDIMDHEALYAIEPVAKLPAVSARDIAQIQYTSGTTGFPKGALLHHHGLVRNARDTAVRVNLGEGQTMLHHMPLFHTTGCGVVLLGTVSVCGTVLLAPIFDPQVLAGVIERERVDLFMGVPTMIVALIEEVKKTGTDVSSVKGVFSGGAMVSPELARESRKVLGKYVQIVYGQTESSPVITGCWSDDSLEDLTQTIGQPLPGVDVSIRDPKSNTVLPVGTQGEICCRGYLVMEAYHDNPEASATAIDSESWLHTGDLGTMDERGYVRITGRVKEMIIRGGENLFPAEIENAMTENSAIAEVAVIGVPDPKWGEQVVCYMRASGEGALPDDAELKAFIRARLSPQKTPFYWRWVDEWPLTGSGKIQKFKLVEKFAKDQAGKIG